MPYVKLHPPTPAAASTGAGRRRAILLALRRAWSLQPCPTNTRRYGVRR